MRRRTGLLIAIVCLLGATAPPGAAASSWKGVDETVVEKFAEKAGRPATEPLLNTDRGDLLLFLFLLSGAIGGFIAGYAFRALFPPKARQDLPQGNHAPPR